MVPKQNIVVGLDVGSSKVACCAGVFAEGGVDIIGLAKTTNAGLRRGMIVDIEDTVSAISACLEETERMAGVPIVSCVTGVGGAHIISTTSRGVIAVSRSDGEITGTDIERVVGAARAVAMPPNKEILHVVPRGYIVDGQMGIKDPLGLTGIRLEVEAQVIGGSTSAIKNLTKCVAQAGLDIDDLVFSPLATARILLSKKELEIGAALIDIGAGTTSLAVFEEGELIHCNVLPVGSMHITNDIAIGLRTSLDIAEKIKLQEATPIGEKIRESETIDLSKFSPEEKEKISRKYLAEITEARLTEIFSLIKDEFKKIGRDGMLPGGIIFTGGGSQLEGLTDFAKEYLRLPAKIGRPSMEIGGMVDKLNDPIYATSAGLMFWGFEETSSAASRKLNFSNIKYFGGVVEKAKDILKHFLP